MDRPPDGKNLRAPEEDWRGVVGTVTCWLTRGGGKFWSLDDPGWFGTCLLFVLPPVFALSFLAYWGIGGGPIFAWRWAGRILAWVPIKEDAGLNCDDDGGGTGFALVDGSTLRFWSLWLLLVRWNSLGAICTLDNWGVWSLLLSSWAAYAYCLSFSLIYAPCVCVLNPLKVPAWYWSLLLMISDVSAFRAQCSGEQSSFGLLERSSRGKPLLWSRKERKFSLKYDQKVVVGNLPLVLAGYW